MRIKFSRNIDGKAWAELFEVVYTQSYRLWETFSTVFFFAECCKWRQIFEIFLKILFFEMFILNKKWVFGQNFGRALRIGLDIRLIWQFGAIFWIRSGTFNWRMGFGGLDYYKHWSFLVIQTDLSTLFSKKYEKSLQWTLGKKITWVNDKIFEKNFLHRYQWSL